MANDPDLIDTVELARRLGRTTKCIRDLIKRGKLPQPFVLTRKTRLFRWSDVLAAICAANNINVRESSQSSEDHE